ncbi:MAG: class I SAM-dependent methyltransferase [Pseudomonadota bacterium]
MTACHVCGAPEVEPLEQKGRPFRLVSSDVQPVTGSAEYSLCPNCLTVQKAVTPGWQQMADRIYANYDINHQSQGVEPTIFDSAKGSGPRSLILLRNFFDAVVVPDQGRLLDVGCSNGNLLKSFHGLRPGWRLSGAELVDQWRETVLALPGVEAFYSGPRPAYEGRFDIISLSHLIEHIPDPVRFLKAVAGHLTPQGRVLVATPNLRENPSDLIIADHCTHFDEDSFGYTARRAGLHIELLSTSMLPKELVAVLSVGGSAPPPAEAPADHSRQASTRARCLFFFELLDEVRRTAEACIAAKRPFGVMGSSIAALWTMLELEGRVDFFVDEDEHRIGHALMDRPIVSPAQVPAKAVVFIPMSVAVAGKIMHRWKDLPIDFRYVPTNRPM